MLSNRSQIISVRSLLLSMLVAGLVGLAGISLPIDLVINAARIAMFDHKASGDIILVGVDDKSLQASENGAFSRREHAKLIDRINAAGARRLLVDFTYVNSKAKGDLKVVADAVKRMDDRIVMATRPFDDPVSGKTVDFAQDPIFGEKAKWGSITVTYSLWMIWDLPRAYPSRTGILPAFSSIMADKPTTDLGYYRPDYSIDLKSVPFFSALDVLQGKVGARELAGKQVIFAPYSAAMRDTHFMPGKGRVPGAYFQIAGAETLMRGNPVTLGWLPMLLFATASIILLRTRRFRHFPHLLVPGAVAATIAIPTVADRFLITMDSGAALVFLFSAGAIAMRNHRRHVAWRESARSGLPNFEAMRLLKFHDGAAVVAARIVNFDEVSAFLGDDVDALIEQARRRIAVATAGTQLYHDDNGVFAWVCPPEQAETLDHQLAGLAALFTAPVVVGARKIDVAVAFGINAVNEGSSAQRIAASLVAADQALRTRSLWSRHLPVGADADNWRHSFHSQLDEALASGGIWVAYQPQIDLRTGIVIGAEALARWTHPERGPIPPDEFIREAERSNDIYRLTLKVIDDAIRTAADLAHAGTPISMSVNLSAALLDRSDIVGTIRVMLASSRLQADRLTIEITETARIEDSETARRTLDHLRQSGIKLSIDDYGTGQSNLEYLTDIEADEIKIDKRFVSTMCDSDRNYEIVKSTIDLAHRLGAKAVAEGVEDERTHALLCDMACDIGQGYLYGKPMIYSDILRAAGQVAARRSA